MPQGHIPLVSLFFSLRVEAGHFLFIGVVLLIIALARRAKLPVPQWAQLVPPYAIGSVAMFGMIQHIAAFENNNHKQKYQHTMKRELTEVLAFVCAAARGGAARGNGPGIADGPGGTLIRVLDQGPMSLVGLRC